MNNEQSKINPDAALKLAQIGAKAGQFDQVMNALNEFLRGHNLMVAEGQTWAVYGRKGVRMPDGERYHEFVTAAEAVTDALTIAFERTKPTVYGLEGKSLEWIDEISKVLKPDEVETLRLFYESKRDRADETPPAD